MAKAVATCTCATCGNKFKKITTKESRSIADSWEKWASEYFDECSDCYEKRKQAEREEESRKAAEEARELGFPDLTGTPKQIAWAEKIRIEFARIWSNYQDVLQKKIVSGRAKQKDADTIEDFKSWVLSHEEASWWIDRNRRLESSDVKNTYWMMNDEFASRPMEDAHVVQETTLEPKNKTSSVVCKITATEKEVVVKSAKDQGVIDLVKACGYRWDGSAWRKGITVTTGSAEDRLIEIGNRLLIAGYPVKTDPKYHSRIISGEYEPETARWVTWDPQKSLLKIHAGGDYLLIDKATKIPGSRRRTGYREDVVVVSASAWQEIGDFARIHDFKISPGAASAMENYKASVRTVSPIKGEDAEYHEENTAVIMESSRDVLDDLKDD